MECVLVDVVSRGVRDARPHPEERACRRRSAKSKARTRVSKDEDGRLGFALMLRDASQHASAVEAPEFATCCDAPQHEGENRRSLWVPALAALGRDDDGLVRAKHQPAAVRNDRRRNFIVSGLLFTMTFATATCRAVSARTDRPVRAWRDGRAHTAPRSRSTSSAMRWPSIAAGMPQ